MRILGNSKFEFVQSLRTAVLMLVATAGKYMKTIPQCKHMPRPICPRKILKGVSRRFMQEYYLRNISNIIYVLFMSCICPVFSAFQHPNDQSNPWGSIKARWPKQKF